MSRPNRCGTRPLRHHRLRCRPERPAPDDQSLQGPHGPCPQREPHQLHGTAPDAGGAGLHFPHHHRFRSHRYLLVRERLRTPSIEAAVRSAMNDLEGAYSLVIASPAKLIAVRDPMGSAPCVWAAAPTGPWCSPQNPAPWTQWAPFLERDIRPGEIVTVGRDGVHSDASHCDTVPRRLCVFEFICFARPDSVIDGCSVTQARQQAGAFLAKGHPVEADVVVGVPDSGLDAALGYASASGIPYALGFTKNKYVGRTFLAPQSCGRMASVSS